jgi:uroporphyrin-III C-methyltransferase/precorrin-2 dehydrogenase/sirohydrochlorin ferrochelatase
MAPLYPLFLKLEDQPCLVVGAGPIGARKAKELLAAGAKVRVVSLHSSQELEALRGAPGLVFEQRAYAAADVEGCRLVIAATGDEATDTALAKDARRAGALVNAVDSPSACDFFTGGALRRGPVQVLVGTGGHSPALTRKLRQRLEALIPPSWGALAEALGGRRQALLARWPHSPTRAGVLEEVLEAALSELAPTASAEEVERLLDEHLAARE